MMRWQARNRGFEADRLFYEMTTALTMGIDLAPIDLTEAIHVNPDAVAALSPEARARVAALPDLEETVTGYFPCVRPPLDMPSTEGWAMTDDLAACLLAAIEETEKIALAAVQGNWTVRNHYEVYTDSQVPDDCIVAVGDSGGGAVTASTAVHIARQDPHATLIRCAGDRRTVERHPVVTVEGRDQDGMEREGHFCDTCDEPWPCGTIQDRAFAYDLSTGVVDDA